MVKKYQHNVKDLSQLLLLLRYGSYRPKLNANLILSISAKA